MSRTREIREITFTTSEEFHCLGGPEEEQLTCPHSYRKELSLSNKEELVTKWERRKLRRNRNRKLFSKKKKKESNYVPRTVIKFSAYNWVRIARLNRGRNRRRAFPVQSTVNRRKNYFFHFLQWLLFSWTVKVSFTLL